MLLPWDDVQIVGATIDVKTVNSGDREGAEIVQLFVAPPGAGIGGRPLRSLVAFDKVLLGPGASAMTSLKVPSQHLTITNTRGEREIIKGDWRVWVGADGENSALVLRVV